MKNILGLFESPDLVDTAADEGVSEDGDGPIEGVGVGSTSRSTGGVETGEGLDEIPGRGTDGAVSADCEGREGHAGMGSDLVLVLGAFASLSDGERVVTTSAKASDDGAVDGETAGVVGVGGDPYIGGSGSGGVKDGAGVG